MKSSNAETLQTAFRRFEHAAFRLEERHARLEQRARRLEQELVDAHRRIEGVLDALDSGVAVVAANGTIERTNRAFDRFELIDDDGRLSHPVLAGLVAARAAAAHTATLRAELDGEPRDLSATAVPVGDGHDARVLKIEDVTAIRREEQEGGRKNRLEALGRMAAELAHEVRNPLGGIRLFAGMLEEDLADQPARLRMVEQILAATQGLEGTVSNLLNFASPRAGARECVDLGELARDTSAWLAPACSVRGVQVAVGQVDDACLVRADPEGLRQVLLNLLGNALGATDAGGTIELEVGRTGGEVTLTLTDDGRGIAPEDLPRVFDPFFSRSEGGTGLGLSIVHRIIENAGGRITLDSRLGEGTRVRVTLPAETDG